MREEELNALLAPHGVAVRGVGGIAAHADTVLTVDALRFVAELSRAFEPECVALMEARTAREAELLGGAMPTFLPPSEATTTEWKIADLPPALHDRRVDVVCSAHDTRKFVLSINSGAQGIQVDFDDGFAPTWANVLASLHNIKHAIAGTLAHGDTTADAHGALLLMRPRSLNLFEKHVLVDGAPVRAVWFDFGVHMALCARTLHAAGRGPFFYLPKLENAREAALWDRVFTHAERALELPHATCKGIVLIENILASFEMEEMLFALREHSLGLNAGKWDYIFSYIKKFRGSAAHVCPARPFMSGNTTFMRAYITQLLRVCHKHGAPVTGGMAPYLPTEANHQEMCQLTYNGMHGNAKSGLDGALVAHPTLVLPALEGMRMVLPDSAPMQLHQQPRGGAVGADALVAVPAGTRSEADVCANIQVVLWYVAAWRRGVGMLAVNEGVVEDLATAEICRALLWSWVHHGVCLDGEEVPLTQARVEALVSEAAGVLAASEDVTAEAALVARDDVVALVSGDDLIPWTSNWLYERME